jgi:hypothetical protein
VKRVRFVAFCILALCSLLLVNTGTVNAATVSGYERTDWMTATLPTIDGQWNDIAEWNDTDYTVVDDALAFGSTWDTVGSSNYTRWIIEFFNDTTDDDGDYWDICLDSINKGGIDLAPGSGEYYRIRIEGHDTLTVYEGSLGGWSVIPGSVEGINWANTLSASPNGTTPHWILEIEILKKGATYTPLTDTYGVRVAVYDESNDTLLVWPPDAANNNPNQWATNTSSAEYWIPEPFSIIVVVLLSSAAVAVSFYCLRRHPKTEGHNSKKLK